ncbi:PAS domain S-box protein [Bosea sp. 124]|uniref:hybrid sensor histidine kinase/response regulator n=1 Tax=Bosea sp. 124 TaxID=2135642 RepID=UPI000D382A08|nr:PAS domain S-box protein [Bosea sp. 124]PTM41659.1 PAS domain S-box-containing protein [Bosea sp. 124]
MRDAASTPATTSFLKGDSEAAALIAAFDWSSTSLGPIADWPEPVKSIVGMMLHSPLPIVTLWGEAGVMIYNDAYSGFAGGRHPRLLGSDVREGWPEVADFNDNVVRTVFRQGRTLSYKDQELTLNRGGGPAQVWMNLDYSPVIGENGTPLGVIAIVVETTEKVAADRQLRDERLRLQQMYEQAPSFMAMLEGPEHRFTLVNEAYQELIGHRDVLGKPVAEALPDAAEQGYIRILDEVFVSGRAFRSSGARFDVQPPNGGAPQTRFVDFVFQPIADAIGTITGIFVDGIDVTDRIVAQETIRASEAQFRTFAQAMPNHVWTALPNGPLDWFNERVGEYSGREPQELLGTGWVEIVHPDDRTDAAAQWQAALAAGEKYQTEFRIRSAAGEYRWHLVRALPIRSDAGEILRWIGTNTDIHEQKLAEVETVRDRDRLWTLSQELMLVCDYEGVVTAVNPSATRLLGWSECEMVGKTLSDFVHPDDIARTAAEVGKLSEGATTLAFENRYLCKDGSYRLLDWTAVPDAGRIHAIGRDITEERRLARDRDRIWNLSPVLKVVASRAGVVSAVNPSWTNVLGWQPDETIGRNIVEFVESEDRDAATARLARVSTGGTIMSSESVLVTRDGGRRRIAWTSVPDADTIYAFGRDITAETEAAAALASSEAALRQAQKMEAIGQLTGGVAHDFNNLLQVVSGNLQLLSRDIAGNEKAGRRIHNAMEGVARGSRLASQLLAFGRRQPLAPKVINLGKLIRGMDEMLRRALGEAVEIESVVAGGLWNTLVDPGNVENALLNLAINARDAMEGSGKLTIEAGNAVLDSAYARLHPDVVPGRYVMLAVTDTGSGIPADIVDKVFDPFFSTKPEGKGTGLGLSMVYGFVKQSGGHVKIYSEPGEGTTIRLYLPRSGDSEDELVSLDSGPIAGGTETILVAEDDKGVRETVIETLTDLGYRVLQAPDAKSALAIVESGIPIDLLFTDVVMPGPMKSTELARKAVERIPGISVLFTSGYTENSIVHEGRLDEGVELLSKPYSLEQLARKVRHQLANAAQRRQATSPAEPLQPAPAAAEKLTVLLCEDDALIAMATVDMLEELGHSVLEAGTARAALDVLDKTEVDILLTDVGLPDMPGTALVEKARAARPSLPVIFATGHSRVEGAEANARTALVVKPYRQMDLEAAIARVMNAAAEGG